MVRRSGRSKARRSKARGSKARGTKARRSKARGTKARRTKARGTKNRQTKPKPSKKKARAGTGVKKKLPYTHEKGKYPSYGPQLYIKKQGEEREMKRKKKEYEKIKAYLEKKRKERSKAPTIFETLDRENKSYFQWKRDQAFEKASRSANPPPGQM